MQHFMAINKQGQRGVQNVRGGFAHAMNPAFDRKDPRTLALVEAYLGS